ncbi:MAG: amidohydrolase [Gemmatimonadota bacterium]
MSRTQRHITTAILASAAGLALVGARAARPGATSARAAGPRGGVAAGPSADLVLRGGVVFVGDAEGTKARAVAIRGDRILAVGPQAEGLIGPSTRVVELRGRLVTAGMNDAHLHLGAGGLSMLNVRLEGTTSLARIEARVREAADAAPSGEWVTGRGWDHTRLPAAERGPDGWPPRAPLDRAAPDRPVFLKRVDGHTAWVNGAALRALGIDETTPDPPGGRILHDPETGEPTGILLENAADAAEAAIPEPSDARAMQGLEMALDVARRTGLTSVQTRVTARDVRNLESLRREGRLTLRVYGWRPLTDEILATYRRAGITEGFGGPWLRIGAVKAYVDGTLGSRTAWMLEPYADDPGTRGISRIEPETLRRLVLAADSAGLQVLAHAIGDAANREVLDIYEEAARTGPARPRRHRIEHAQVLDAADIPRFARLGVVASMQPTHATSDMRWAEARIGHERAAEGAYAWRSLLDAGAHVAFGTDFAVEPMAPIEGLYSAVTRQSRERPGEPPSGWLPEQRLDIEEAIRLYTAGSAWAEFEEDRKGRLEPGMLADVVVWDRNLLEVPPERLLQAKPDLTIVGGRVVFRRSE